MTTLAITLQGIGRVPAKRVADIRIGDVLRWNYGYESAVLEEVASSRCYRTFRLRSASGEISERRLAKSRLVAYVPYAKEVA